MSLVGLAFLVNTLAEGRHQAPTSGGSVSGTLAGKSCVGIKKRTGLFGIGDTRHGAALG